MTRNEPLDTVKLSASGQVFICERNPDVPDGLTAETCIAQALAESGGPAPELLYWDAQALGADGGWMRFGRGGLDPILAGEVDLSGCVGVSERALQRLVSRGAVKPEGDLGRAAALLARAPTVKGVWCAGLTGVVDPAALGPLSAGSTSPTPADRISVAILVEDPEVSVEPFFAALRGQAISAQLDVLVIAQGLDAQALRVLTQAIEAGTGDDSRIKVRRYSLSAGLAPAYLANLAVGLASYETVVVASARCVPVTPHALERLAGWAISGDSVAACPRIISGHRLVSAGCGLRRGPDSGATVVFWNDLAWSEGPRTVAAPAPGMFAVRRSAWLAAGGLRGSADPAAWTAQFAFGDGPKGRTLLVGSEMAEWIGPGGPDSEGTSAPVQAEPNAYAATALCNPQPSGDSVLAAFETPKIAQAPEENASTWTDAFPSSANARILVFADSLAASQAIPFIDGLASSRAAGRTAVRIVDETAFPPDGRAGDVSELERIVGLHVAETSPTVIVGSRLGHAGIWRVAEAAARRAGVPLVFHIDDDIFDLPAILGIERYRLARNPRRLRGLYYGLNCADRVLAATPALAERLRQLAPGARVTALETGAAGRPHPRPLRPARSTVTIAYMGSASHDSDLSMVVPALNAVSAAYPFVEIVLFGSIATQPAAQLLNGRLRRVEGIRNDYSAFRQRLRELKLDIGLAPLCERPFNDMKTPTKWVEYAEAGAATVVSPATPYRPIIEAGAAMPATAFGWEPALRRMIEDAPLRTELVKRADELLSERFSWRRLEQQVVSALGLTEAAA